MMEGGWLLGGWVAAWREGGCLDGKWLLSYCTAQTQSVAFQGQEPLFPL